MTTGGWPVRPVVRAPALGPGTAVASAVAAALLAGLGEAGRTPLVVGVVLAQALMGATWLVATEAPFPTPAILLVGCSGGIADALLIAQHAPGALTGLVAVTFVLALLVELVRRNRRQVVVSLASTMSGVVFAVLGGLLFALRRLPDGPRMLAIAMLALAVGLGAAALIEGDLAIVVALGGSALAGLLIGIAAHQPGRVGAALGGAAAAGALSASVAVGLSSGAASAQRKAACRTLGVVLPPLLAAPAAYAVALVLTG